MSSTPRYAKRYELDRALGIDRSPVPAGPVRDHVRALVASGLTPSAISRASGVSRTGVRDIAAGRTTTVRQDVAARLLRVNVATAVRAATGPLDEIPALGTIRRVQALLALGHTHATIEEVSGCRSADRLTLHRPPRCVTRDFADRIDRAYRALCMVPGASEHTRRRAARAGYVPPLGWDDIDTDTAPAVTTVKVTVVEEAEFLAATGVTLDVAAERLGFKSATGLERHLYRAERTDVLTALRGAA